MKVVAMLACKVKSRFRQTTDVRQWDCETTCGWLESLGLEAYCAAARSWLGATTDGKGLIAAASHQAIEKELAIKHPMHKKKIVLALTDLLVSLSDRTGYDEWVGTAYKHKCIEPTSSTYSIETQCYSFVT